MFYCLTNFECHQEGIVHRQREVTIICSGRIKTVQVESDELMVVYKKVDNEKPVRHSLIFFRS